MLDDETKQEVADKIFARLKSSPKLGMLEASIVQLVAINLDHTDDPFVVNLLRETLPLLQNSDDPEVEEFIETAKLEPMLKRLTLVGRPLDLEGDLLGGGQLDWGSYRGKVVLVDFSATWCPDCIMEAPNVLAMYEKFKDKGFDVVAVSLDITAAAAERYVDENGIQWATLFPKDEERRRWDHPLAVRYGVVKIPTAILVDQEGKVVNLHAFGSVLREELERLLGEPKSADASGARDTTTK
jgi:thiol-disulfide isomerase/thioredoxin